MTGSLEVLLLLLGSFWASKDYVEALPDYLHVSLLQVGHVTVISSGRDQVSERL